MSMVATERLGRVTEPLAHSVYLSMEPRGGLTASPVPDRSLGGLRGGMAKGSPPVRIYLVTRAHFPLAGVENLSDHWWCKGDSMSHEVYYQFIVLPGQACRAGARGGKTTARNRRQRLSAII